MHFDVLNSVCEVPHFVRAYKSVAGMTLIGQPSAVQIVPDDLSNRLVLIRYDTRIL